LPETVPSGRAEVVLVVSTSGQRDGPARRPKNEQFRPSLQDDGQLVDRYLQMEREGRLDECDITEEEFEEAFSHLCMDTSAFKPPPGVPLEPLAGMAKGSSFTVERLLEERQREAALE